MAGVEVRSVSSPDETRPFADKGQGAMINVGGHAVLYGTFEPGWRWSEHVKPIPKTNSCQGAHMGYVVSGRMKVVMDDGSQEEFGTGDLMIVPPGHDAWVVGGDRCVVVDWQGIADYAKR